MFVYADISKQHQKHEDGLVQLFSMAAYQAKATKQYKTADVCKNKQDEKT